MDDKAREELVERVAYNIFASGFTQNMANARGVARAVIEPAVRDECAKVIATKAEELRANDRDWGGPPLSNSAIIGPVLDSLTSAIRGGSYGG